MKTFEAQLRKNLLRLWALGAIINSAILFWVGAGKLPTAMLIEIALGLAGLNALIGAVIYIVIMLYKQGKVNRS